MLGNSLLKIIRLIFTHYLFNKATCTELQVLIINISNCIRKENQVLLLFTLFSSVHRSYLNQSFNNITCVAVDLFSSIVKSRLLQATSSRSDRFPFTGYNLLTLHFSHQLPSCIRQLDTCERHSRVHLYYPYEAIVSLRVYYTVELGRGL